MKNPKVSMNHKDLVPISMLEKKESRYQRGQRPPAPKPGGEVAPFADAHGLGLETASQKKREFPSAQISADSVAALALECRRDYAPMHPCRKPNLWHREDIDR